MSFRKMRYKLLDNRIRMAYNARIETCGTKRNRRFVYGKTRLYVIVCG